MAEKGSTIIKEVWDNDIEAAINVGAYSVALDTKKPNFFEGEFIKKADVIIELNEIPSKIIEVIEKLL